jgi:hypothetical protein
VEEEIPPNWEGILPFLTTTTLEQQPTTCTTTPLIFQEPAERGCIVEEQIPLQEQHSGNNSTATMEEDPAMDSTTAKDFSAATMEEDPVTN